MKPLTRLGLLLLVLAVLTAAFLQWKLVPLAQEALISTLTAKGIAPVSLRVAQLGPRVLVVEEIALGDAAPLTIRSATVRYTPNDLRARRVDSVTLDGIMLEAYPAAHGVVIRGLEALMEKPTSAPPQMPVTRAALPPLPFEALNIERGQLTYTANGLRVLVPLNARARMGQSPALDYEASGLEVSQGEWKISCNDVRLSLALEEAKNRWVGKWSIGQLIVEGSPVPLPPLTVSGTVEVEAQYIRVEAKVSGQGDYRAMLVLENNFAAPEKSLLRLSDVRLPLHGGHVGLKQASIPLKRTRNSELILAVEQVSIASLMQALTGERASGTGLVTGDIPITVSPSGALIFHDGALKAEGPGTIRVAPEVIPGDTPQIALVRDALANLEYTMLVMAIHTGADKNLSVRLTVEGKNPDMPQLRPVRLNVHLDGDLLDLIKYNVMAVSDPKTLLKKAADEQKP